MRYWHKGLLHITATLLLGSATMGCSENNVSLFIRNIVLPTAEGATCSFSSDPGGEVAISPGRLDKLLSLEYENVLLVGNQLTPRGDQATLRPESSRVQFYEAEVSVFDFAGATLANFTVPTAGFAEPASGTEPGWGIAKVLMVPSQVSQALATDENQRHALIVRSKIYGTTLGGQEVSTGYWDWPLDLCESTPNGLCGSLLAVDPGAAEEQSCAPGQGPTDPRFVNRALCNKFGTPLPGVDCNCDAPAPSCPGLESE